MSYNFPKEISSRQAYILSAYTGVAFLNIGVPGYQRSFGAFLDFMLAEFGLDRDFKKFKPAVTKEAIIIQEYFNSNGYNVDINNQEAMKYFAKYTILK